jgi:hypothetical protein
MEEIDGHSLPSYRGDIINGDAFTEEARVPDPNRLISVSSARLCARCIELCYSFVKFPSFLKRGGRFPFYLICFRRGVHDKKKGGS